MAGARHRAAALPAVPGVLAPIGPLGLHMEGCLLVGIEFLREGTLVQPPDSGPGARVVAALLAYFADPSASLDVPMALHGTPFQRRLWTALREIPPGRSITYGVLATALETSPRAVGGACRANKIPVLVPCHRVVSATGVGGFAGQSGGRLVAVKAWLLAHEQGRP